MLAAYPDMSADRNETYKAVVAAVVNNGGEEAMVLSSGSWWHQGAARSV